MKLSYEEFHNIKKMLNSDIEDDYNIAIQVIKNLQPNKVMMTLLLKSLYHNNRVKFFKSVPAKLYLLEDDMFSLNLEWKNLFPVIKKHISKTQIIANVEMRIIEEMILELATDHLHHIGGGNIIKNIKIELNYE